MLQFALIGVGAWGRNYISTMKLFKDCRIKYLCSNTIKSLQPYKHEYVTSTNYRDLFSYPDIDGIIIATPNATHYEICHDFLSKGYNILIEKPLVEQVIQARKLQSLQKKGESKVLVGHTYLFDPAYIKTKEIVGDIGPIRYISYTGTNNGPYRKDTSALWDIGPHAISLCLDILQKEPVKIAAWGVDTLRPNKQYYDFSFIKLMFADQIEAFIKISWLSPMKKRELIIVGDKSGLVYDAVAEKRVSYYANMIPEGLNLSGLKKGSNISFPSYESKTALQIEMKEFIDSINDKKRVVSSDLDLGVKVTQLLNLAEKSIKEKGKEINVKK